MGGAGQGWFGSPPSSQPASQNLALQLSTLHEHWAGVLVRLAVQCPE